MDPRASIAQFQSRVDLDNETRRNRGRIHTSNVQIQWFDRNSWSHPVFADLCDWALDENGSVHPSQISHIRNHKMRMFGLKVLDGFGAVNLATWAYHHDPQLLQVMGCRPLNQTVEEILKRSSAVLNPITGCPLDQGGWMLLFMGYIEIPNVPSGAVDPSDSEFLTAMDLLGPYVSAVMQSMGMDVWTAHSKVSGAMDNPAKAKKLMAVAAGVDRYDAKTLAADLDDICCGLEAIDKRTRSASTLLREILHGTNHEAVNA
ncbi:hypothetical protein [Vulcanococcus sp.]|uniref:hypothetical protein n=1 Tax=Vulcanococcus sp. TaxID=2856995 RepID=UPI003C091368